MAKIIKNIILTIAGLLVIFIILDFGYLWANLRFDLGQIPKAPPELASTSQAAGALQAPNTIIIDSLGVAAPIVYESQQSEAAFQKDLEQGVVHYPQTALPGQAGNCYLFGHSSDFLWKPGNYKNVFAVLPRIAVGAKISVADQMGNIFVYTVTKSYKVASNDMSVLSQSTGGNKILTLQTSYPVGTALARWIIVAQMQ